MGYFLTADTSYYFHRVMPLGIRSGYVAYSDRQGATRVKRSLVNASRSITAPASATDILRAKHQSERACGLRPPAAFAWASQRGLRSREFLASRRDSVVTLS